MLITVDPQGTCRFLWSDDLADLAEGGKVTRASHVERSPKGWTADLSPVTGPELGPFRLRSDALDAEIAYLEANVLGGSLGSA